MEQQMFPESWAKEQLQWSLESLERAKLDLAARQRNGLRPYTYYPQVLPQECRVQFWEQYLAYWEVYKLRH